MAQISRRTFLKLAPVLPLLKVTWPQLAQTPEQALQAANAPNVLVLVFDTLSARHVSLYGYQRETTPNLARFAERATVFHNHHAAANFTSPGTSSILTGTYPWSHRAFHLHGIVNDEYINRNVFTALPDYYHKIAYTHNLLVFSLLHQFRGSIDQLKKTRDLCLADNQLADRLFYGDYSDAFWAEWLFLRGGATPPSSLFLSMFDRLRRFDTKRQVTEAYGDMFPRGIPNLHSLFFVLEDAIDWIKEQVLLTPQPFFSYFHLLPPHEPYTTRKDFVDIFADGWQPPEKPILFGSEGKPQRFLNRQRREYDEYLAYTDSEFGRLLDALEQSGVLDNTYLILTSDHGELFERGIRGHVTQTLYEPLLHVPLLISRPGQKERVDVFERTSCVDLLPTIMKITGQPVPDWTEGQVLPTFGDGDEERNGRFLYALEAKSNPKQAPLQKATMAIVADQYKLVRYFGYKPGQDLYEMYDLQTDPEEMNNIFETKSAIANELKAQLAQKLEQVNRPFAAT
ncbi:MAG: DUF4976 domain-containing protein [Chloroflexi bacterium]|nr:MAG: DUF4976 domain-containing protein [Chloroflexota bacterium]